MIPSRGGHGLLVRQGINEIDQSSSLSSPEVIFAFGCGCGADMLKSWASQVNLHSHPAMRTNAHILCP